eukprot:scaffold19091_cov62-Cylindrotheca_fusiformis.AAC.1
MKNCVNTRQAPIIVKGEHDRPVFSPDLAIVHSMEIEKQYMHRTTSVSRQCECCWTFCLSVGSHAGDSN